MTTEYYIRIPGILPPPNDRIIQKHITDAVHTLCPDALVRKLPAPILQTSILEDFNQIAIVRTRDGQIIQSFNVEDMTDPRQSRYSIMTGIYDLAKRIRAAYEMPRAVLNRYESDKLTHKPLNKDMNK